jgi:hypothetical protein
MGKRDTKIIPKVQLLVGNLCSHLRQGLRFLLHMLSKLLKLDPASMISLELPFKISRGVSTKLLTIS